MINSYFPIISTYLFTLCYNKFNIHNSSYFVKIYIVNYAIIVTLATTLPSSIFGIIKSKVAYYDKGITPNKSSFYFLPNFPVFS